MSCFYAVFGGIMPKTVDLTGKKFGKLTVLRRIESDSKNHKWECKCDCGNVVLMEGRYLQDGLITNCGCAKEDPVEKIVGRKAKDLTGRVYGRLTVLERVRNMDACVMWKCRCSCGQLTAASSYDLTVGLKKSCGCIRKEGRKKDITGKRYGKLVALYPLGKTDSSGSLLWRCRCDCGNEVDVSVASLNKENKKSCGCLKKEYQRLVHDRLHLVDGTCIEWLDSRKSRSDNTSGFRGVFRKKNGKYNVSIGFKKRIFYIGTFEEYPDAVEARLRAEKMIHDGFIEAHEYWQKRAACDPEWAEENPFRFDVAKENGSLVILNSMEKFMEADKKAARKPARDLFLNEANLEGKVTRREGISMERTSETDGAKTENTRELLKIGT